MRVCTVKARRLCKGLKVNSIRRNNDRRMLRSRGLDKQRKLQHSGRVWLFSESRRLLSLHQNGKHGKKINNKRRAQRGRHSQVWFRRNVLWDSCQKVLQSSCSLKKRFFLHDLERTLTSSPPSSRNCRSASPSKPGERGGTQTRRGVR